MINVCAGLRALGDGVRLFMEHIIQTGCESDVFVGVQLGGHVCKMWQP